MKNPRCAPLLDDFYRQYLVDQDCEALVERVLARYEIGTVERLADHGQRLTRRAAVLLIGLVGDYDSNQILGRALVDTDRGVRTLAENGIRSLWCRSGTAAQRKRLESIVRMNTAERFPAAIRQATQLLKTAPELAEVWNQRAVAHFGLGAYELSLPDCAQTLELNPYHYGAATGMAQCHLRCGDRQAALDSFRRALRLNPGLEGVRAHVLYLQRTLNNQD